MTDAVSDLSVLAVMALEWMPDAPAPRPALSQAEAGARLRADGYLNRFDINEAERTEIHRFAPAVRAMMVEALADPAVRDAHAVAVMRRDERVARTDPARISREG